LRAVLPSAQSTVHGNGEKPLEARCGEAWRLNERPFEKVLVSRP